MVTGGGLWLLWGVVSGGGFGNYRERYLELGRGRHTSMLTYYYRGSVCTASVIIEISFRSTQLREE
jgi:hypothetical protein